MSALPLLSQAYEEGEISSTHVREITRVATPETEIFWYEAAKKSTTRQIEKLVAFSPKGGLPPAQLQLPGQAPNPSQAQLPGQAPNPSQWPILSQAPFPSQAPLPAVTSDKPLPADPGDTAVRGDTDLRPAGLTSCATSCDQESQNGSGKIRLAKANEENHRA